MSEYNLTESDLLDIERLSAKRKLLPERQILDAEEAKRFRALWSASGFGERHARPLRDGTYKPQAERDRILAKPAGWLIALIGPRKTGKTQLGAAIGWKRCEEGKSVVYIHTNELLLRLKATWREKTKESELDVFKELAKPDVVYLDEIQERSEEQWDTRMIANLIDIRYRAEKNTLLAGNYDDEASFRKSVGPSIFRRLVETGGVIEMKTLFNA